MKRSDQKRLRPLATFVIDQELLDGIAALKARDGVSASETVRRAIRAWLEAKGVMTAARPPAKRSRKS